MDIWKLPNVLVLHFKRFMQTASSPMKLETKIEYPSMLDMSKYVVGPHSDMDCTYKLYAAMYHSGGIGGGHYVARAFHSKSRKWYLFDDASVKQVPPAGKHTTDAYVVFYAKCPPKKQTRRAERHQIDLTDEVMNRMFTPKIRVNVINDITEDSGKQLKKTPQAKLLKPEHARQMQALVQHAHQHIPMVRFSPQTVPGIPPFFQGLDSANIPQQPAPKSKAPRPRKQTQQKGHSEQAPPDTDTR